MSFKAPFNPKHDLKIGWQPNGVWLNVRSLDPNLHPLQQKRFAFPVRDAERLIGLLPDSVPYPFPESRCDFIKFLMALNTRGCIRTKEIRPFNKTNPQEWDLFWKRVYQTQNFELTPRGEKIARALRDFLCNYEIPKRNFSLPGVWHPSELLKLREQLDVLGFEVAFTDNPLKEDREYIHTVSRAYHQMVMTLDHKSQGPTVVVTPKKNTYHHRTAYLLEEKILVPLFLKQWLICEGPLKD